MLLLTIRGTPFFFMGDELGLERGKIPDEAVQDPFEKLVPGYGLDRDPERVPLRWDATTKAGFTEGVPWLPMVTASRCNVLDLQKDPCSILHLYRELIRLRKQTPALHSGDYAPLRSQNDILSYERFTATERFRVALNITHEPRRAEIGGGGKIALSTYLDRKDLQVEGPFLLRPDEGVIVKLR
jgi:alpha-glucosidase